MNFMDLDLQRERRVELLREAERGRFARSRRERSRRGARGFWRFASVWVVGR